MFLFVVGFIAVAAYYTEQADVYYDELPRRKPQPIPMIDRVEEETAEIVQYIPDPDDEGYDTAYDAEGGFD